MVAPGCVSLHRGADYWMDKGKLRVRFQEDLENIEGPPKEEIRKVFHHSPVLMKRLEGVDAPWVFVYRVNLKNDRPWYLAKGPLTPEIQSDSYLNFTYILEHHHKKLRVTYEDLKLGDAFVTRYFFPVDLDSDRARLYVVGFYSDEPISWQWYRKMDRIASTVRIYPDIQEGD